jgi:hypothetical protein
MSSEINSSNAIRIFVLLLFVLMAPTLLLAQTAKVSGSVLDSSGGAVVGAIVTATNQTTNIERSTTTTDTGAYTISNLPPSVYTFTFTKDGFKATKFAQITLTVDQVLTLDAKLEVGSLSSTVEVAASAVSQVDTETATLSNVVEHEQMTELPLILRDPYQLVLLGPGVTQSDSGGGGQSGGVSVNGGRETNNNFLLDGADNNDAQVPFILGGLTSQNPDSTEEFRVLTNNFAPEYGRNNGAIIDVITRSGTNNYHGDVFYFGRWDALGARDYFNHNIDPTSGDVEAKNPYVRNLYGASFGGPIRKDKTFFFINYQGDRFITTLTNASVVPTAAFKTGIFTYTLPNTTTPIPLNVTTPNAGNNITNLGLDPVIQKIFSLYPNPTVNNPDGATGTLFFPSESREKDEDAIIKIDQKINKDNTLSVRYNFNYFSDPNQGHFDFLPGDIGGVSTHERIQGLSISLTTTFGSTFVNEFRLGANRINSSFVCSGSSLFDSIGFTDINGRGADFTLPGFAGFGCQTLGDSNGQSGKEGTYQLYDAMSKVVKSHTFKWGAEGRYPYSNNFNSFGSREAFTFNALSGSGIPTVVDNSGNVLPNNAIEDEVGALLGVTNSQAQTQFYNNAGTSRFSDELNFRQHEVGAFFQDSWKLKPNLTITYGLRWEWYGVPYDAHGNLANIFTDTSAVASSFAFTPVGPGTGHQLYNDYFRNFEPRFGFAWDPFKTGRTSVRGGIGVFSDRVYGNLSGDVRSNPPLQASVFNTPAFDSEDINGAPTASGQLQNQVPPGLLPFTNIVSNGDLIFPDVFDAHIKPPLVVSWNLGIQREITHNLTVDVNYVGNHGTRILRVVDGNPPQPSLVAAAIASGVSPSALQFGNLYFGGTDPVSGISFNPVVNNTAFFDTFEDQTSGHSWYDGLQLQVNEHLYHGLQIGGSYTYAHALDDSSDPLNPTFRNGNFPVNSFDLRAEKGNSGFDTRHRGVVNFVYSPNIGRGRGHFANGVAGQVLGGWEISGIATWQTGLPYDIFGFVDTLHTNFADRATVINPSLLNTVPATGKIIVNNGNTGGVFTGFNTAAFNDDVAAPPFGVPSNIGRNHWYGPGINNYNVSLSKTTRIKEKADFQLRFEFYNLFNRTQFTKPDATIGDPLFGYSTSTVGQNDGTTGARQVQIGAKLNF